MDQYYQELYTPIAYHWLGNLSHAKKGKSSKSICFCKNQYHGIVSFFADNIIDLRVENSEQESVFYLHFQIKNLKMLLENIKTFFDFLNKGEETHVNRINDIEMAKNLNILFTCSTGLTTSYYAYLLENYFKEQHLNVNVSAVGYRDLDAIQQHYDYIFVAPQISYQYVSLHEKYGDKVFLIDTYGFATGNIHSIIDIIQNK